jgi:hypothetical protein
MRIKRRLFKQVGTAALIAVFAAMVLVGFSLAADGSATILTAPTARDVQVYIDQNHNGLNDPEEFVGVFDVYSGDHGITISWPAVSFAQGANGSYRVALLQNTSPLGAAAWAEVANAHHWANNPNGTTFTMGPFNANYLCRTCPTRFVVQPETYQQFYDPTTQTYEYEYTNVGAAFTAGAAALTQTEDFIVDLYVPGGSDADKACVDGSMTTDWCTSVCQGSQTCVASCVANFYISDDAACGCSVKESDCEIIYDFNEEACGCQRGGG